MSERTKNIVRVSLLFVLLLLPVLYALFTATDLSSSWIKSLAYLCVVVSLLLLPALFLPARIYFIAEGILNFFFFPIEIASLYLNHQPTSWPFLLNIVHTNGAEVIELLGSFPFVCVLVVALWVLYFVLAARVENVYLFGATVRRVLLCSIAVLVLLGFTAGLVLLKRTHPERPIRVLVPEAVELLTMKFNKIYPYNLYIHSSYLVKRECCQRQLSRQTEGFTFGIQPVRKPSDELYMLVIGEASRYDHWSLNGYDRPTTPRLDTTGNILSFEKVYTLSNQTEVAVPMLLTRADIAHQEAAYTEKALPDAFQEAGFWSGYISMQISNDLTENIQKRCDYSYFSAKNFDVDGNYDSLMIARVQAQTRDTNQFFVLHSLGSHFRYEHRYPQSFSVFQPVLSDAIYYGAVTEKNKSLLINAYDNSILYTDFFLSELIRYVRSLHRVAAIVYISDHGESFWDDERKLSLHGSYAVSEYEYHVPFMVWYSDEYAQAYPEKVKALQQNKTTPVSSDVVFYSLLDIAGIQDCIDSARSVCSVSLASQDTIYVHSGAGTIEPITVTP